MSHKATNWAVTVRGLKPAAKVVLWHLADRHNKDTGRCDPSQERLADDCEISRASLNNQLKILEDGGFITRIQRVNAATKRQHSTAYALNMNVRTPQDVDSRVQNLDTEAVSKKDADPCPKNGESRVQNLDTNPVREPGKNLTRERVFNSLEDFQVDMIKRCLPWAGSSITTTAAQNLLAKNLVTQEQCEKARVL